MENKFKKQYELLLFLASKFSTSYSANNKTLTFKIADKTDIKSQLKNLSISYETVSEGIEITKLSTIGFPIFYNFEAFSKDFKLEMFNRDFGILTETSIFYDFSTQSFLGDEDTIINPPLVLNHIYYLKILQLLSDTSSNTNFANYFDSVRRIIFVISGTKGTMSLGYPLKKPQFDEKYDLRKSFEIINSNFEAKGYVDLFKSEVYDVIKNEEEENRIPVIVSHLLNIIENTNRNFDVYMSNFSYDALKDKLKEGKLKYYNLTKDILSKTYTQITSVPIAISASAYSTYKVDDWSTLILIVLGFGVYVYFVLKLSSVLKSEIDSVSADFLIEKADLIKNSKLKADEIKVETDTIEERIKKTKDLLSTFKVLFIVLSFLFGVFVIIQLAAPTYHSDWFITLTLKFQLILDLFHLSW